MGVSITMSLWQWWKLEPTGERLLASTQGRGSKAWVSTWWRMVLCILKIGLRVNLLLSELKGLMIWAFFFVPIQCLVSRVKMKLTLAMGTTTARTRNMWQQVGYAVCLWISRMRLGDYFILFFLTFLGVLSGWDMGVGREQNGLRCRQWQGIADVSYLYICQVIGVWLFTQKSLSGFLTFVQTTLEFASLQLPHLL